MLAKNFQPKYRLGGGEIPSQATGNERSLHPRVPEAPRSKQAFSLQVTNPSKRQLNACRGFYLV